MEYTGHMSQQQIEDFVTGLLEAHYEECRAEVMKYESDNPATGNYHGEHEPSDDHIVALSRLGRSMSFLDADSRVREHLRMVLKENYGEARPLSACYSHSEVGNVSIDHVNNMEKSFPSGYLDKLISLKNYSEFATRGSEWEGANPDTYFKAAQKFCEAVEVMDKHGTVTDSAINILSIHYGNTENLAQHNISVE